MYNILEASCNVVLAHPKYMKAFRGKKTDKRDAKWIADIFKHDLVQEALFLQLKATDEEVLVAVDGELRAEQAEKLRIIRPHMDSFDLCKNNFRLATAEKYLPQLNLVMTAPGIQAFSAIDIISEIGVDMSVFPTSKHLFSWAGPMPQNNESAGKKKTTKISRAGTYIKPLLVQCALCAV